MSVLLDTSVIAGVLQRREPWFGDGVPREAAHFFFPAPYCFHSRRTRKSLATFSQLPEIIVLILFAFSMDFPAEKTCQSAQSGFPDSFHMRHQFIRP